MLKRILCFLTAAILLMSFVACAQDNNENEISDNNSVKSSNVSKESTSSQISKIDEVSDDTSSEIVSSDISDTTSDTTSDNKNQNSPLISIMEINSDEVDDQNIVIFTDNTTSHNNYKLRFSVSENINNFKFFSLNDEYVMESENAVTSPLVIDEILYETTELSPEKDLVILTYLNDAVANRGISFVDAEGITHYFSIQCNMIGLPDFESVYLIKMNIQ